MIERLVPIYAVAWRIMLVLLTLQIAIDSAQRYFTGSVPPPPPIVANAFANPFLILHVAGAMTALLVGPLQFVGRIRTSWPDFHRVTGRFYLLGCAIGAPTGLVLSLGTTAGPTAGAGFAILAVLWPACTWLGWRAAVERRFGAHREWMLRSYALAATGITLRLMIPAAGMLDLDFVSAYRVIAWLSWTMNLALVEYHIRRSRSVGKRATR